MEHVLCVRGVSETGLEGVDGGFELGGLEDFVREGGELKVKVVGDGAGFEAGWFG
jgi:hypothetical protein